MFIGDMDAEVGSGWRTSPTERASWAGMDGVLSTTMLRVKLISAPIQLPLAPPGNQLLLCVASAVK